MRLPLNPQHRVNHSEPAAEVPALPRLAYPLFPTPRIAVLGLRVEAATGIHVLDPGNVAELAHLRPMALAGSWADLCTVAQWTLDGELELNELRYPVLVFSTLSTGRLSREHHAQLWEWFHVPSIEQIRSADGTLLAMECESRQGFHLTEGVEPSELSAVAIPSDCGCATGQTLYRLKIHRAVATAG